VADTRTCEQCGIVFTPRREHARFCSAACRVAWNQEHTGNPQAGAGALVFPGAKGGPLRRGNFN